MSNVKRVYDLKDDDEYPYVAHLRALPKEFSLDWLEERAIVCSKIGRIFFFQREEDIKEEWHDQFGKDEDD